MAFDGDLPTEDLHLISSCPCWAYTKALHRTAIPLRFIAAAEQNVMQQVICLRGENKWIALSIKTNSFREGLIYSDLPAAHGRAAKISAAKALIL